MIRYLLTSFSLAIITFTTIGAQDNCNVFLWNGDTCKYDACKYLEESKNWFQLTKEYQIIKDNAIEICPEYAAPYRHKSTAYLKTGDFIGFKKLIDEAVRLNPSENLAYRGWCRFQFFRDYIGAIKDIEELESITKGDIGYCQNGDYHLQIAKALCYKMLGNRKKAIQIIERQIQKPSNQTGLYDYLHLGVLCLEEKNYDQSLIYLDKQSKLNELAENQYYKAILYKETNNLIAYKSAIEQAEDLYHSSTFMYDVYTQPIDKIYLKTIEKEMSSMANQYKEN